MKARTDNTQPSELIFREKVERIIGERVRPILNAHSGDIYVKDVRGGDVWVVFTGACGACPSAQITLEEAVQVILKEELKDEFGKAHLVNETDEDLLDFAKKLLNKS